MSESKAKNELVYQALKNDIINGTYLPGHHLDKDALRQKYGFSTTPISFALVRLFNEALLEKHGRDGFYTRKNIQATELKEIYLSTGAILKMAAAEFFTNCPNVPLKFYVDDEQDVVSKTELIFEAIGGLLGQFAFQAIIKANNDRLHLIRTKKSNLFADKDREEELAQLIATLESRDLSAWNEQVDAYIACRLSRLTELSHLTEANFRTS